MTRNQQLRDLLRTRPYSFTSGVFTPIQARIAQTVGLEWVYVSGYSCSLGYLTRPDLGFVTMTEMSSWARLIANAVSIPVVVDGDDGFGDVLQVMRTVEEFERAGASGLNIEDQRLPRRCGHLPGTRCLPVAESVAKVKAALHARSDPSFVIIARTDAVGAQDGGGLAGAIERGKRYADAGADVVWAEFPTPDRGDAEAFASAMKAAFPDLPLFFNYSSSFRWTKVSDPLSFRQLGEMGYRLIVVGLGAIHAGMRSEWDFMEGLRRDEERAPWRLETALAGHPTEDHHAMADQERFNALGARFRPEPD
jgi:isocitrate lyase